MTEDPQRIKAGNLYGSLEMLVLTTLHHAGPMHGLQVAERIQSFSGDSIRIEIGALYPALHRLEKRGVIEGEWRISERRRRAKFYDVTPKGVASLDEEIEGWRRYTSAVTTLFEALESQDSGGPETEGALQ